MILILSTHPVLTHQNNDLLKAAGEITPPVSRSTSAYSEGRRGYKARFWTIWKRLWAVIEVFYILICDSKSETFSRSSEQAFTSPCSTWCDSFDELFVSGSNISSPLQSSTAHQRLRVSLRRSVRSTELDWLSAFLHGLSGLSLPLESPRRRKLLKKFYKIWKIFKTRISGTCTCQGVHISALHKFLRKMIWETDAHPTSVIFVSGRDLNAHLSRKKSSTTSSGYKITRGATARPGPVNCELALKSFFW